jgi:hypothetical protein
LGPYWSNYSGITEFVPSGSGQTPNYYSYNISVSTYCDYYVVTVQLSYCEYTQAFQLAFASLCDSFNGPIWPGHWNETVVVYAPQAVNFYLQTTTTTWLPVTLAFADNNPYITYDVTSTWRYTVSTTQGWSGNQVTSSATLTSSVTDQGTLGHTLEQLANYNTTGDIEINGVTNRTPFVDVAQCWGNANAHKPASPAMADYRSLGQYNKNSGCALWNTLIPNGNQKTGQITAGGSTAVQTGTQTTLTLGAELSLGLGVKGFGVVGGVSIGVSYTYQDTLTATTGYAFTVDWSITNNGASNYFSVCMDSASLPQGVVVHSWIN